MYLLNPDFMLTFFSLTLQFTFHYVSIKSTLDMEILTCSLEFTFHYVSIKSLLRLWTWVPPWHLHSTMYLLNRESKETGNALSKLFTFHYVSIKSERRRPATGTEDWFTFHYVSIKSVVDTLRPNCLKHIYIPLCIY